MSGLKNTGQLIDDETETGFYDPMDLLVNFAVPNMNKLREFDGGAHLPSEIPPGIITEGIELKATT